MQNAAKVSLLVLLLAAVACSSSSRQVKLLQPEIALQQEPLSQFLLQYRGPIAVGFHMAVRNPSGEPIVLRRLDLQNIGGGAYLIRRLPVFINEHIAPGETKVMSFTTNAYAQGGRLGSTEPVTLRGIAYFEGPDGTFQKIFTQTIRPSQGAQ